jgi:hypothetical protein
MLAADRRARVTKAVRRRARAAARMAAWASIMPALWLLVRWTAGPGPADYTAGFFSGAAVCAGLVLLARVHADRWARRAGVTARAAASRPVPHWPKPARTPIHDSAVHQQGGAP